MPAEQPIKHGRPVSRPALNDPCLLCEMVAGRTEVSKAYEDEHVIAVMDLYPVTEGHLFVFPRDHAKSLEVFTEEQGTHLFQVAHRLAKALYRSGLPCEGVNMFLADGEAAFQEVFHVHLHVFPRMPDDGFRIDADWRQRDRAELDAAAEQVRHGYQAH
jgi:histidine triad (HIT) family protein